MFYSGGKRDRGDREIEGREELKEENAARNATDGCGRLSLVCLPGGCASAQVGMGQMEGCVLVWRDTHTQISWKRRQWVAVLRCCARDTLLTHFKH